MKSKKMNSSSCYSMENTDPLTNPEYKEENPSTTVIVELGNLREQRQYMFKMIAGKRFLMTWDEWLLEKKVSRLQKIHNDLT
ncbi:MAG: hypothetical protein JZU65_24545 [Chlorobium sp.]|nr:hypothetical protein [Chlorobium sp.]